MSCQLPSTFVRLILANGIVNDKECCFFFDNPYYTASSLRRIFESLFCLCFCVIVQHQISEKFLRLSHNQSFAVVCLSSFFPLENFNFQRTEFATAIMRAFFFFALCKGFHSNASDVSCFRSVFFIKSQLFPFNSTAEQALVLQNLWHFMFLLLNKELINQMKALAFGALYYIYLFVEL